MNLDSFKKENLPVQLAVKVEYADLLRDIATDYGYPFASKQICMSLVMFWFKDEKIAKLLEELLNEQK